MILATEAGDLDRSDAVAQFDAAFERPATFDPVQQRTTEGIAAPCGVEQPCRRHAGHVAADTLLPEIATLRAERDDHTAQMRA